MEGRDGRKEGEWQVRREKEEGKDRRGREEKRDVMEVRERKGIWRKESGRGGKRMTTCMIIDYETTPTHCTYYRWTMMVKIEVGEDSAIEVGEDNAIEVGEDNAIEVGEDNAIEVGEDNAIEVGEDNAIEVGVDNAIEVGVDNAIEVGVDNALKLIRIDYGMINGKNGGERNRSLKTYLLGFIVLIVVVLLF